MSRLNHGMSTDQGHTSSVPTKSLLRLGFFLGTSRLSTPLAAMSTANSYALSSRSTGLQGPAAQHGGGPQAAGHGWMDLAVAVRVQAEANTENKGPSHQGAQLLDVHQQGTQPSGRQGMGACPLLPS